jgi:NAD(P)-dependent dehydrogenase (short-subunit alcohol dehydrogenase family)
MKRFEGRVAVITGAASGIGRALATRLAAERTKLVLADVEQGPLDVAVQELREGGATAVGIRTDVRKPESVQDLADGTIEEFGAVHLVCNNAGVATGAPFADLSLDAWKWIFDVNFAGVLNGCRAFLPMLLEQDEGHIVNTSSSSALSIFLPTGTAYVASKFAVQGLSENLFHELAADGNDHVGVSVLCPGLVATNITNSERNLPGSVRGLSDHPARRAVLDRIKAAGGMAPSRTAEIVLDGIRERRFFILTHPEDMREQLETRLAWLVDNAIPPRPDPNRPAP